MIKVVLLQCIVAAVGLILGGMVAGTRGVTSAALGSAAVILPSLIFALRLSAVKKRPGASYATAFFVGELVKLALCIGLLAAVRLVYPEVHWGAVLIGLIVTLQANFLAFLVRT
ncbi:ATP synthase subunit I [Niveibacterium sp. SC-1]|uniref:ATP synthase subunit I n=1 Tax=Niveibacterium sp. SC-1 TaxID=3135646 RepID=UPI00312014F9